MADETIILETDRRGVATLWLNRPAVHNAYDRDLLEAFAAALARLAHDPAVRLVLLRGKGPHFQAGADLAHLKSLTGAAPEANLAFSRLTIRAMHALRVFAKPVVALVHGGCFGGGVGLVAGADVAIAEAGAVFALTEVRWGVTPSPIIPALVTAMGVRALGRYGLTAERFGAAEALRMGLLHAVCPDGGLDAAAAPIVEGFLMAAPEAVAVTKRLVRETAGAMADAALLETLAQAGAERRHSAEAAEGLQSFAEKRKPRWYPGTA
jgi:methylglutaconyl-CoA hydratase